MPPPSAPVPHKSIKNCYSIFVVLLFTCFTQQLFAQCPPSQNALQFAKAAPNVLLPIIEQYTVCPESADSLGYLYHRLAVQYYLQNDYFQAIPAAEKATAIQEAALSENHPDIASSLYVLGASYYKLGNYKQAETAYKRTIPVLQAGAKTRNDSIKLTEKYQQLANVRIDMGDYDAAINYAEIALQKSRQLNNLEGLAENYSVLSRSYLYKKDYPAVIENATRTKIYYENVSNPIVSIQITAYINLGLAYYENKDYKNALKNQEAALSLAKKIGHNDNTCKCYINLGLIHLKKKNYTQTENYFNKIIQDTNLDCNRTVYNNLGDLYAQQNLTDKARSFYEKAVLEIAGKQAKTIEIKTIRDSLSSISNKEYLLTFVQSLAQHNAKSPAYQQNALDLYHLLDAISDAMREQHYNSGSKLFWRDEVHPIYEEAIALCLEMNKVEDAFYFSEKSKAILLYDRVSENLLQVHLADSLQQQLNANKQRIDQLEAKDSRTAEDLVLLLELQDQKTQLLANIEQRYPEYFRLKYQPLDIKLDDATALLTDDKTALIEFFYGKKALYTFHLDKINGLKAWQIPLDSNLTNALQQFTKFFRVQGGRTLYQVDEYAKLAYQLYQKLLPNDLTKAYTKLLLLPDGYLNYLPFDALLCAESKVTGFADLPYLGNSHAISYAYSIPILSLQKASKNQAINKKVLAIFPEFAQGENGQIPLTHSAEELSGIESQLAHKTLRGVVASQEQFRQYSPDYQIIHLASHASGGTDSLAPSIEFIDNSFLLTDLYSLDLRSDLVVLSSCETGMGKYAAGEGVMSLARGFTYAGANSLVSTLWKVNDASTAKLMTAFYRHLAEGQSKGQALFLAKQDYLGDEGIDDLQKSPYFWAGFVYVGNDTVVELERKSWAWVWALGLFLGLLVGWLVYRTVGFIGQAHLPKVKVA